MEVIRLDLIDAHPSEVVAFLAGRGVLAQVYKEVDGLHIVTDVDASTDIAAFTPTVVDAFEDPLPPYLRAHIQHMKDYRSAVRNSTAVTDAQTTHVIADIIDAIRYLNSQITED